MKKLPSPAQVFRNIRGTMAGPGMSTLWLFGMEGICAQYVMSMIYFGNNIYATNLGATDTHISLLQTLPQLVSLILLLPVGILGDRLSSRRQMPIILLIISAVAYLGLGSVPLVADGPMRIPLFLIFVAFSAGLLNPYNSAWQAFLSDMVPITQRNRVITFRTRFMTMIGMAIPLIVGPLLSSQDTLADKLTIHQILLYSAVLLLGAQIFVLTRIKPFPGMEPAPKAERFSLKGLVEAGRQITGNKVLLGFFGVALMAYLSWHMDWSMFYVSQRTYIMADESQLSIITAAQSLMQLAMLGFWAKVVQRRGTHYAIIFAMAGLAIQPLSMITGSIMPDALKFPVFLGLNTLFNIAFPAFNLCIMQMLLEVVPQRNKSLIISLYTIMITVSNAIMPFLGVQLYIALGSTQAAMIMTSCLCILLRSVATLGFFTRYRRGKIRVEGDVSA